MKGAKLIKCLSLLITVYSCTKGHGSTDTPPAAANPVLSTGSVQVTRPTTNTATRFSLTLSVAATKTVTVSYKTTDGTAKAGKDYVATSGTLTIPAGSQQGNVDVIITGDSLRQDDL